MSKVTTSSPSVRRFGRILGGHADEGQSQPPPPLYGGSDRVLCLLPVVAVTTSSPSVRRFGPFVQSEKSDRRHNLLPLCTEVRTIPFFPSLRGFPTKEFRKEGEIPRGWFPVRIFLLRPLSGRFRKNQEQQGQTMGRPGGESPWYGFGPVRDLNTDPSPSPEAPRSPLSGESASPPWPRARARSPRVSSGVRFGSGRPG